MTETTNPTPGAPTPASTPTPEDDEAATFLIALVSGVLGALSLMAWFVMFVAEKFSDTGSGIAFFQHRGWFLVAGTGLLVLGIGLQIHRILQFVSQRRSLIALNVALMTVLALALTGLANYVGARHYKEFDWTRSGVYSISDESAQVVAHLEKPIKIWVVWPTASDSERYELVRRLLDHYRSKSDKITVEVADPEADLAKFQQTVKLLGLEDRAFEDLAGLVVQSGYVDEKGHWNAEKSKHVSHRELFEQSFDPMGGGAGKRKFKGEQVVTNAIIEVSEPKKPKLYFLTGHQEADLEGQNPNSPTEIGFCSKILKQRNYDVESLDILKREQRNIPDDCTVLVIAGPQRKLADQEIAAVEAYLKQGGHVLALMSPVLHADPTGSKLLWDTTGLEPVLKRYNVDFPQEEIVGFQRVGPILQAAEVCLVNWFDSESKITAPLATSGARALMVGARPLKVLTENPHAKLVEVGKSSENAFVTDDPQGFLENPSTSGERKQRTVLVTVEDKVEGAAAPAEKDKKPADAKTTKLVICGDSHWISNRFLEEGGFRNEPLFFNCISWLVGQERFTKEPVAESGYKLDMGSDLIQLYSAVSLLGMPLFAIILGVSVWLIRRR